MSKKDMLRSAWTRVRSKKQIIREFACGEHKGKISLLKILELSGPFVRRYENREIVLADAGYYWLQLAEDRSHAWFTVMFDDQGRFIEIYVDVTDGNDALAENPTFDDMYLDYVVADGKVYKGFNSAAGELGHIVIQVDGRPCTCGRRGCWETYSSATGLTCRRSSRYLLTAISSTS